MGGGGWNLCSAAGAAASGSQVFLSASARVAYSARAGAGIKQAQAILVLTHNLEPTTAKMWGFVMKQSALGCFRSVEVTDR